MGINSDRMAEVKNRSIPKLQHLGDSQRPAGIQMSLSIPLTHTASTTRLAETQWRELRSVFSRRSIEQKRNVSEEWIDEQRICISSSENGWWWLKTKFTDWVRQAILSVRVQERTEIGIKIRMPGMLSGSPSSGTRPSTAPMWLSLLRNCLKAGVYPPVLSPFGNKQNLMYFHSLV